jgi:flagellar basal body-associated protein FliL
MDTQNTQKKTYSGTYIVVAAVICLVVGFGIGWYAGQAQPKSQGIENEEEQATTTAAVNLENLGELAAVGTVSLGESDDIEVENQAAGQTVSVKSASLGQITWLAVRDNNDDVFGNILGAKRLTAGQHTAVKIELLRPTLAETS